LRNVVERLLLLSGGGQIDAAAVRAALPQAGASAVSASVTGTLAERVEAYEKEVILAELARHHHHMTNVARALGLERSHLYKKCQHLGIDLRAVRGAAEPQEK